MAISMESLSHPRNRPHRWVLTMVDCGIAGRPIREGGFRYCGCGHTERLVGRRAGRRVWVRSKKRTA